VSNLPFNLPANASLLFSGDDLTLQYIVLWSFVLGGSLVWTVVHLHRNARIRKTACDSVLLKKRIKTILQHSREVLYGFDFRACRFEYMSPACFTLTGYTVDELETMGFENLLEQVHPEDREKLRSLIKRLSLSPEESDWLGTVEYRFCHRDGQFRFFSDHLSIHYDEAGKPVAAFGSLRDVTQIARLEESLRALEKKFQAGQKMAGLGLLASGIAHDFNNLMTVILGNTELALMERGGSDGGMLDEIKKATLRAADLANQMLVYTGKTELAVNTINLSLVVKEMASLLDVSISKKVKLEYCLDEKPPLIRGDVSQIRQVAMNLITNASEAIGDRPGVIAISTHAVELRAGELESTFPGSSVPPGHYVRLEVSDTGAGMTRETLDKIFNPLFTTKVTGRGLGLAALLNAVERHNGAVTVGSEEGRGTVFRIYFPASDPVDEDAACTDGPAIDWRGWGTALVADDEESIRDIAAILLQRLGFRVLTAADGLEMVNLFTRNAGDITLLLMDLNMPKLNGVEAALRIRHINPKVPLLFMSGYPRDQVMERFGGQAHTEFIKKPFQTAELMEGVRRVMTPRQTEDESTQ
jgi:PAS domain S-box-containing protein